jgi:hypothetical protein
MVLLSDVTVSNDPGDITAVSLLILLVVVIQNGDRFTIDGYPGAAAVSTLIDATE